MLREDLDAGLRGRVRHRRPGIRPAGGRGRHCEDRAGLPRLHPGQDALDRQERRSEIAFDGGAPAVLRHVLEGPWRGEAASRVRDEDVDRPEVPLDLLSYRLDLGELGQVTRNGDRSTTFLLNPRVHRGQGLRIPTVDRDECALPREETGDCCPDTSGAARHPGDFAAQTFHDDAPVGPARALPATTRPQTSSRIMIAWMTRSGTVLGPMPIAIVNTPTNVPINAKPWTVNPILRTARGRIQVARTPPSSQDAITLSAGDAAPCANSGRKTRSGTPRPTGMSRIQRAGTSESIRPRASRL